MLNDRLTRRLTGPLRLILCATLLAQALLASPANASPPPPDTDTRTGSCDLYPIALHTQTLAGATAGTTLSNILNGTQPGAFGWLSWAGDPSEPALVRSLTPPGDSAKYANPSNPTDQTISIGDDIHGRPGAANSKALRTALDRLKTLDISVPIWDTTAGTGNTTTYHVANFARVRLSAYQLADADRISARFLGYTTCGDQPPPTPACPVYAVHDQGVNDSQFLAIDVRERRTAALGPLHKGYDIEGLDLHPRTRILYATAGSDNRHGQDGYLYRVDKATGAITPIGGTGFHEVVALSFRPSDATLWGWSEGSGLIQIDPATGAGSLVYRSTKNIEALAWSDDGARLYAASGAKLSVYDPRAKTLTQIAKNLPGATEALDMRPDGRLAGSVDGKGRISVFAYDLATLRVVASDSIATSYDDIESLAWPEACGDSAPTAADDTYSVDEDGTLTVPAAGVLSNDTSPTGDPLTATLASGPLSGALTLNADGSFVYTPLPNFTGTDTFTYQASDGTQTSNVATVTIAVTPVTTAPVGVDDAYTVAENTPLSVAAPGVLANDTNPGNSLLTAVRLAGPYSGTLTLGPDGSLRYLPNADFSGADSFSYRASNGRLDSNITTVRIAVTPVNGPPAIVSSPIALAVAGQPYRYAVDAIDPDAGDALTFVLDRGPAGMAIDPATGLLQWAPALADRGEHAVTLLVRDTAGLSDTQDFVLAVGDDRAAPIAADDAYAVDEDGTLAIPGPGVLANDADPNGDPLTVALVSAPLHGTLVFTPDGSFSYAPDPAHFSPVERFSYTAGDSALTSNTATVTITVNPLPVRVPNVIGMAPPAATKTITEALLTVGQVTTLDGAITLDMSSLPSAQGWQFSSGSYSIPTSPHVVETRVFSVSDRILSMNTIGTGHAPLFYRLGGVADPYLSSISVARVRVLEHEFVGGNANDPAFCIANFGIRPGRIDDYTGRTLATDIDATQFHTYRSEVILGDRVNFYIDDVLVATLPAPSSHGPHIVFGDCTGGPNARAEIASYSFTQPRVVDQNPVGGTLVRKGSSVDLVVATGPARVTVPNVMGMLQADAEATIRAASLTVGAITTQHSATVPAGHVISQRPLAGTEVVVGAAVALVVSLGPVPNQAPVAADDAYSVDAGQLLRVPISGVLANDSDPNATDVLTATLVSGPVHGTLVLTPDGSFSYTPAAGFSGSDNFSYKASDGRLDSNPATVTITVGTTSTACAGITNPVPFPPDGDGPGGWVPTTKMLGSRNAHTATRLNNGKVLVVGGNGAPSVAAELFDPVAELWTPAAPMHSPIRWYHTATLLQDGRVLIVGGSSGGTPYLNSAEIYDPIADTWAPAAAMQTTRLFHTAALLNDGRVLVTGGWGDAGLLGSAEVYDPTTDRWSPIPDLHVARYNHTATRLNDGRVLVAGGRDQRALASVEIYDPATNSWLTGPNMRGTRFSHTATLLPDGTVLVVGGRDASGDAELFDPSRNAWRPAGSLQTSRVNHTATLLPNGMVVITGGYMNDDKPAKTTEIYDPAANRWSSYAHLSYPRAGHTATLLPSGAVLLVGGDGGGNAGATVRSAEIYRPGIAGWTQVASMREARWYFTTTQLCDRRILAVGGFFPNTNLGQASAEIYDSITNTWQPAASMHVPRARHIATLLRDGRVLVAGGYSKGEGGLYSGVLLTSAEIYDPQTNSWSFAAEMRRGRSGDDNNTVTRLSDGRVLFVGGQSPDAEIYDPTTNTWSPTGPMQRNDRSHFTTTLLRDGKVLVASGMTVDYHMIETAEIYDPATNSWSSAGSLHTARLKHRALLLPNGKVLVVGGYAEGYSTQFPFHTSTELYDPDTNTWSRAAAMHDPRYDFAMTLLGDGTVLVSGGAGASTVLPTAERYDPVADRWFRTGSMNSDRGVISGNVLSDGKVLVIGGNNRNGALATAEIYDPRGRVLEPPPPAAREDTYTTNAGQPLSIAAPGVLANDRNADGSALTARLAVGPAHGTLTLNADGSFNYTPESGFSGVDRFMYRATDGHLNSTIAMATITVLSAPTICGNAGAVPLTTASYFTDPDAQATFSPTEVILRKELSGYPNYGVVDGRSDVLYTGQAATWHFTLPSSIDPATVQRAFFRVALIADDHYAVDVNSYALAVWANNDVRTASCPADLPHGTPYSSRFTNWVEREYDVSISSSTYTFTIANPSATAPGDWEAVDWVELHLQVDDVNYPPVALDDTYIVGASGILQIASPGVLANDRDPDGDLVTAQLVSGPAHGTLTLNPDGAFTYTPDAGFGDTDSFTYTANDGSLASNIATVTITRNHAPAITSTPVVAATAGQPYAYQVSASDLDAGDVLRFTLVTSPTGMVIDRLTGRIGWIPSSAQAGSHTVVVQVTDEHGASATQRFTITVVAPPTNVLQITSTPIMTATEGMLYSYDVDATTSDPPLVFSLVVTPTGMTIDPASGLIQWTPSGKQAGSYLVAIRATDGGGRSVTQRYILTVAEAINNPPIITSNPVTIATEGVPYRYAFSVFDPDDDNLSARLPTWPDGMDFDPATAAIVWTPSGTQSGIHEVVLEVMDGRGGIATQRYTIAVAEAINTAPVITSAPVTAAAVDYPYQYNVAAEDADRDLLAYSLIAAPAGMTIRPETGLIEWTPAAGQVGDHSVEVQVTDGRSPPVAQSFVVRVQAQLGPDTTRPVVSVTANPPAIDPGASTLLTVTASDNVGVIDRALTVNGEPIALDANGRATFSSATPGLYTAVATARDAAGNVGTATTTVRVNNPADTTLPTVALTSPADDAAIESVTSVIGTASDANLIRYELSLAPEGETSFTPFASGTASVVDGVLGQIDPTLLQNGIYRLRLLAEDVSGNIASTERVVRIQGDAKVGIFTLSFTDLEVPVAGLPIQVIRTYDSRDKRVGDFGVGWTLDIKTVRLQENSVIGADWQGVRDGGVLNRRYCVVPTRSHIVSITLPDGKVYEFEPTLSPACQLFAPPDQVTVGFRPLPGTNATLAPLGSALVQVDGAFPGAIDLTDLDTFAPFDADQYVLTLPDGRALTIDQRAGLQRIADLNGNALTITRDGISHTSGKGVTFTRDGQGRITQVADPLGKTIAYAYDASGDLASVTDQAGNTTRFTYNRRHDLLTIADPRGIQPIRNEYDDAGRLVAHVDASGNRVEYTHQIGARQEIVQDRLGRVTAYTYDVHGNVLSQTDALGHATTYSYDTRGNTLAETDALGQTTTSTYDERDNLLSQTDALGNTTRYTYNARGQVLTTADPLGRMTANTYDASGNLTETRDPLGNVTSYTYDTRGLQTSTTDALGNVTRYEYDSAGNLAKETDPLGHATTYTYDANGNRLSQQTTRTTSGGTTETLNTAYEYDGLNRLVRTTYPDGTSTRVEYNSIGQQAATIDQLGRRTSYEYDGLGRPVKTTYADGAFETSAYDAEGRRTASTDRAGRTTAYSYDALGRLIKTTYTDGAATSTTYDALGRTLAATDTLGNTTRYEYDAAGRQIKVTDALGHATTFEYDAAGNQAAMKDARGNTTRYVYDNNNRRTRVEYPDGSSQLTEYDAVGRSIAQTDQAGRRTRYAYDALGRLIAVTDALGQVTRYSYDELGNQLTQQDALGRTTMFAYDAMGRRVRRALPLGMAETYTYDAAGSMLTKTDFNGKTTTYAYDTLSRLTTKTPDPSLSEPPVAFSYTPSGQRASMSDASGTTTYTYDARDRLTSKATPWGTLGYTYDLAGNLRTVRSSHADGVSVDYAYDALNRLASVKDNQLAAGATTYTYDENGNLAAYEYPNQTRTSYTYDALNRLTDMAVARPAVTLARYSYALGPSGNRLSVAELSGRTASYSYDDLYRLTQETIASDPSGKNGAVGYTYDAVGNRLARASTLAEVPATTATYDANDRLQSDSYDANGNTIASGGHTYAYDFENRLVSMDNGAATFVYDGDGNRVAKTAGGVTTHYLVDDRNPTGYAQVLEEIAGGAVQRSYTYGHDLISQRQAGGVSFYGYDGHGSVRLLTDAAGNVTDRYDYDAFGVPISSAGTTENAYRYAGEQLDANASFYYLRARYYDQTRGRFMTVDSYEGNAFDPTSLHQYLYTEANPVNYVDPSGYLTIGDLAVSTAVLTIVSLIPQNLRAGDVWNPSLPEDVTLNFLNWLRIVRIDNSLHLIRNHNRAANTISPIPSFTNAQYLLHKYNAYKMFIDKVKPKGPWDIKRLDDQPYKKSKACKVRFCNQIVVDFDTPGNILYGYAGRIGEFGIGELAGGSLFAFAASFSIKISDEITKDQPAILVGFKLGLRYGSSEISYSSLCEFIWAQRAGLNAIVL